MRKEDKSRIRILLIQGIINDAKHYSQLCKEYGIDDSKQAVFIFPGNPTHHVETGYSSWTTQKSGGGLAKLARQLPATLSLPTTNIPFVADSKHIPLLPQQAFLDIMRAVGFGLTVVLPVRDRLFDEDQPAVGQYFDSGLNVEVKTKGNVKNKQVEPSFWGAIETTPNKHLGNYYVTCLQALLDFSLGKKKLEELPKKWQTAYQLGVQEKVQVAQQVAPGRPSAAAAAGAEQQEQSGQSICEPGPTAVGFVRIPPPAPRFRWMPWSVVDFSVGTKFAAGIVSITHDSQEYWMQQAKRQQRQEGGEAASQLSAGAQPKPVKGNKHDWGHDFFESKVIVATNGGYVPKIIFTPSGLAGVMLGEAKVTAQAGARGAGAGGVLVSAVRMVDLAVRLIPAARALLIMDAHFLAIQPGSGNPTVDKYFSSTLKRMVISKFGTLPEDWQDGAQYYIPFENAKGERFLFVKNVATQPMILVTKTVSESAPSEYSQRRMRLVEGTVQSAENMSHIVMFSVVGIPQNKTIETPSVVQSFIEGKDEEVRESLRSLSAMSVGLSGSQVLSTKELMEAQQLAQDAKMFTRISFKDLHPPRKGGAAASFAQMPPLSQIFADFKDLFTMPVTKLEALLTPPPKEEKGKASAEVAGAQQSQATPAAASAIQKNYNHWLNHYALKGSASQICFANLMLANVLLCQIKQNQDASKQDNSLRPMMLELIRCLELYETVFVDIAESFTKLLAEKCGSTLLAGLQILGANIQVIIKLFPPDSLRDYLHRVSQFEGLFEAVTTMIASNPTLQQQVQQGLTARVLATCPQGGDNPSPQSDADPPCVVM